MTADACVHIEQKITQFGFIVWGVHFFIIEKEKNQQQKNLPRTFRNKSN